MSHNTTYKALTPWPMADSVLDVGLRSIRTVEIPHISVGTLHVLAEVG